MEQLSIIEHIKIAALSQESIERKLTELRQSLNSDSDVALCGVCKYNEEIQTLCENTGYPFCQCEIKNGWKSLFIFADTENNNYINYYTHKLRERNQQIINKFLTHLIYLKWYNINTKKLVKKAIRNVSNYNMYIFNFKREFKLYKILNDTLFICPPPPTIAFPEETNEMEEELIGKNVV